MDQPTDPELFFEDEFQHTPATIPDPQTAEPTPWPPPPPPPPTPALATASPEPVVITRAELKPAWDGAEKMQFDDVLRGRPIVRLNHQLYIHLDNMVAFHLDRPGAVVMVGADGGRYIATGGAAEKIRQALGI